MQLTSNLAIVATAFAYSVPTVLSLPISGDVEPIVAREAEFDVDAREFEHLKLTARELIQRYDYEARNFLDTLDIRGAADDVGFHAREFSNYLAAPTATGTSTNSANTNTPPPAAPSQPITDQDFKTINAKIKASVTKIIADSAKHAALAEIKTQLQAELTNPASVFIFEKASDYFGPGRSLRAYRRRDARLQKILSSLDNPAALSAEILVEKEYLQRRHDLFTINANLDPLLKDSMVPTHPSFAIHRLLRFAVAKNHILNLLERIAAKKDHPYSAQAAQHLANKAKHRQAVKLKDHSNATDAQESKDWKAHIEQIKKGEKRELIYAAEDQARRLEVIAKGNTGANAAAYKEAVAVEQKANPNSGAVNVAGQNPVAPLPITPTPSLQAKLRRRRF